jgi:hypothetical protein
MMAPMGVMHAPSAASPDGGAAMHMNAPCPMAVPGTQVAAVDTPEGVALVFTAGAGGVDELRRRVAAMAEMHNQHHGKHGGMMGHAGMMMGSGGVADHPGMGDGEHGGTMAPPSSATVQPIDGGARILLTPLDGANLTALRSHVHEHAERMQSSRTCMMDHAAPGGAQTSPAPGGHGSH